MASGRRTEIVLGLAVAALAGANGLALWRLTSALNDAGDVVGTMAQTGIQEGYADAPLPTDDALLGDRRILLTNAVNERTARDVAARLLVLNGRDTSRPIDLYIATNGGWVDSAFAIIDVMHLIEAPVNTWAIGGCYSAGALVLAAGTGRRYATRDAIIMVHASVDDAGEDVAFERLALARYERFWQESARLPSTWFPMKPDASFYVSAEEALEYGIVDEVVPLAPDE